MQNPPALRLEDIANYTTNFFAKDKFMGMSNQSQEQARTQQLYMEPETKSEPQNQPSFFNSPVIDMTPNKNQQKDLVMERTQEPVPELTTDSLSKAKNTMNDIFSKNKEIMTLQEKRKSSELKKPEPTSGPTIVNNYNAPQNAMGGVEHRDPLENLKMQYRSLPAF